MRLIHGDCLKVMAGMADGCIDLTVTSPPYDNLRTYNGYSFDFEGIARQLYRVTKAGGVVVWVVADATIKGSETGTSFRQALYFKECGFNLHDTMIWEKGVVAFPQSARYNQKFEFMFVLSKGKPVFNGIKDHANVSAGRLVTGRDRNPDGSFKERSGAGRVCPEFSLRGNVWHMWNQDRGIGHPAPFPELLAADHIASWSNLGDTVFDPFSGSGTTGKMAVLAGRNFIGIDISAEYVELSRSRIEAAQQRIAA